MRASLARGGEGEGGERVGGGEGGGEKDVGRGGGKKGGGGEGEGDKSEGGEKRGEGRGDEGGGGDGGEAGGGGGGGGLGERGDEGSMNINKKIQGKEEEVDEKGRRGGGGERIKPPNKKSFLYKNFVQSIESLIRKWKDFPMVGMKLKFQESSMDLETDEIFLNESYANTIFENVMDCVSSLQEKGLPDSFIPTGNYFEFVRQVLTSTFLKERKKGGRREGGGGREEKGGRKEEGKRRKKGGKRKEEGGRSKEEGKGKR